MHFQIAYNQKQQETVACFGGSYIEAHLTDPVTGVCNRWGQESA